MVLGGTQFVGVPIAAATTLSFVLVKKRIVYLILFRIVNDMNEVIALISQENGPPRSKPQINSDTKPTFKNCVD
jgi:hypothetical protein